MKKIILSENHNRSVSASLYMVERLINELERDLNHPSDIALSKVIYDVEDKEKEHYIALIREIKDYIKMLSEKYHLQTRELLFSQLLQAKKTGIWVILCDTTSQRLKGYGTFPGEYAEEFDNDIARLQELVQKI
ncbi:MAG: hypothetical protein GYA22_06380 [Bacteroidales bacterium]|nr:hypothetical protein [Bacteroidales bacterium]